MIREIFQIGSLSVSPFGLLMVAAFIAAWAQLRWGVRRLGVGDDEDASALLLAAGIGGVLGAKIYYAILYSDPSLLLSRSGLVWYGGLMLGTAALLWAARRRAMPIRSSIDAAGPAVAVGYAVGRVGCFLVGDDYGMPTTLPWGVSFPYGLPGPTTAGFMRMEYGAEVAAEIPATQLIAVHPTQLYETFAALAIWALGVGLIRRGATPGSVGLATVALLGAERFAVEFLRAKDDRFFASLTLAQLFSAAVVVLALLGWLQLRRQARAAGRLPGSAARTRVP